MARTVRIVMYAVNGSGVGHLTRLVAISRWIRRYASHAGVAAEIWFLSSSEAEGLLFDEKLAAFKLPSKTVVSDAGIDKLAYLALAKQWVWHSLGLLRPDLLVVDSFPRGSFGELLSALDLARTRAFIYRPMKESFASRADFQAMLPLYDLILVPDEEGQSAPVPAAAAGRVRHVGPIMSRERVEMLSRERARAELGIAAGRFVVYVTAGGGGDPGAERTISAAARALLDEPDVHVVVGGGPLYRGRQLRHERLTWLSRGGVAALMPGFDLAVSAAGYNTFFELMHAGIPALFLPQDKIADEQDVRAARAVAAGAGFILSADPARDPRPLLEAVRALRDEEARARAAAAAESLAPDNHARDAAAALLRLILPAAEIDAAEEAISDELLAAASRVGCGVELFIEVMHTLNSAGGARPGGDEGAAEASIGAIRVLEKAAELGMPIPTAVRIAGLLGRKMGRAVPSERAAAVCLLLSALDAFDDWAGATSFVKLLAAERELTAAELAGEIDSFLVALRRRGADLYRGIAWLSSAQGTGASLPTNREMLREAVRRAHETTAAGSA